MRVSQADYSAYNLAKSVERKNHSLSHLSQSTFKRTNDSLNGEYRHL